MSKTRWKAHALNCEHYGCDFNCLLGVVRCADGDTEAFYAGAATVQNWQDCGTAYAEPVWGWWRFNPDPSGEYSFLLAEATGPGRGNFRAACVIAARPEAES